jgi:hypothetical protein
MAANGFEQSLDFADIEVLGRLSLTILAKPVGVGGYVSALDRKGRTIWIADAHRGDGKRFIVPADELLTAFLESKSAIRATATVEKNYCSTKII